LCSGVGSVQDRIPMCICIGMQVKFLYEITQRDKKNQRRR